MEAKGLAWKAINVMTEYRDILDPEYSRYVGGFAEIEAVNTRIDELTKIRDEMFDGSDSKLVSLEDFRKPFVFPEPSSAVTNMFFEFFVVPGR